MLGRWQAECVVSQARQSPSGQIFLKDGLLKLISCVIVVLWFYGRIVLLLGVC